MNNNTFSLKKILILVTILAVPGFLYYLLQEKGKNRYRPLSFYGPKQVAKTFHTVKRKQIPDTIYHTISDFKLINQNGDSVRFADDTSKITVVNFFFTRCPSFCPNMNKEMKRVMNEYPKNKLVRFVSITVDPEYDKGEVLKQYAASYGAKPGKWDFLSGDKKEIYALARNGFLVDVLKDTTSELNFIHSPMLILVDPKKRIRGFYDSSSKGRIDILIDEIKVLITEDLRRREPSYE